MGNRFGILIGFLFVACHSLLAQIPAEERIPIRDADTLESLGFDRGATNVFVWSKATMGRSRAGRSVSLRPEAPETFGTSDAGYTVALGYELEGANVDFVKRADLAHGAICDTASTNNSANARIPVPEGVVLEFFRFWAFDNDTDDDIRFSVYESCQPASPSDVPSLTLIDQIDTDGDDSGPLTKPLSLGGLTANNRDCSYTVQVQFRAGVSGSCKGPKLAVYKMRLQWRRQISPAPAVATFADVPTDHAYFRAIEALAASGITSGCGGANFCPGGNVTRGEMAAFLARALGLHWPSN